MAEADNMDNIPLPGEEEAAKAMEDDAGIPPSPVAPKVPTPVVKKAAAFNPFAAKSTTDKRKAPDTPAEEKPAEPKKAKTEPPVSPKVKAEAKKPAAAKVEPPTDEAESEPAPKVEAKRSPKKEPKVKTEPKKEPKVEEPADDEPEPEPVVVKKKPKNKLITLEEDQDNKDVAEDVNELKKDNAKAAVAAAVAKEKAKAKALQAEMQKKIDELSSKTKKRQKTKAAKKPKKGGSEYIDDEAGEADDEDTESDVDDFIAPEDDGTVIKAKDADVDAPMDEGDDIEEVTDEQADEEETKAHVKEAKAKKGKFVKMCVICNNPVPKGWKMDRVGATMKWAYYHPGECWAKHLKAQIDGEASIVPVKGKGKGKTPTPAKPSAAEVKKAQAKKLIDSLGDSRGAFSLVALESLKAATSVIDDPKHGKNLLVDIQSFVHDVALFAEWGRKRKTDSDFDLDMKKLKLKQNNMNMWPILLAMGSADGFEKLKAYINKLHA
jgi:hypothetical protein